MSVDEDTRWLEWVTKQFETIAGEDKEIDLDEFKAAIKVKEVRSDHPCAKNWCETHRPFDTSNLVRWLLGVSSLFALKINRRWTASVL